MNFDFIQYFLIIPAKLKTEPNITYDNFMEII